MYLRELAIARIPVSRCMHSSPSRETIAKVIRGCLPENSPNLNQMKLSADPDFLTKVIVTASRVAKVEVPDNILATFSTYNDILNYLCQPRKPPTVKGIPKLELFSGDQMPANVSILNYRKKRWSEAEHHEFVQKSLREAGL